MSFTAVPSTLEKLEKNKVKLTITISPEEFQKGIQVAYNKNKGRIDVSGFRKGKVPRKIIERMYGADIFHEDAIKHVLPDAYEAAVDEHQLEPVYRPDISIESASEADGAVFSAELFIKPEVEIDGYYGLTYPRVDTTPTESDIQDRLQSEREKNSRIITVDRPAENGDIISINFTGYVDDEPFEGGTAEEYDLTLGSHTFIDTFEDQLLGCSAGDDVDVNVTFPEDYNNEDLKGKAALFKVEVLEVKAKEYPEVDDEFAQDVSEFDTLEEYRADLAEKISKSKEEKALTSKRAAIIKKLINIAVMDVPEVMYTARVDEMIADFKQNLQQRGIEMDTWLQYVRMSEADLRRSYEENAKAEVDSSLVLEAVAKKEALEISDDEYIARLEKFSEASNRSVDDLLKIITPESKKNIIQDMLNQKAFDFVLEKAVATDDEAVEHIIVED